MPTKNVEATRVLQSNIQPTNQMGTISAMTNKYFIAEKYL